MTENRIENKSSWFVGAGILAAFLSSLCCIGPLILTVLGVTGAAALSKLDIFRIPAIFIVLVLFSVAGFALYRKRNTCEPGSICADPRKLKRMMIIYWVGLVFALLGILSPWWVTWLFS